MNTQLKIASIGMNEKYMFFFEQLLKIYTSQLKSKWLYMGNFSSSKIIDTMGYAVEDADILLIDVDDEYGKRAWYILQALIDNNKMIALTSQPLQFSAKQVIEKPVLNWSVVQGSAIVKILNTFSEN